MARSNEPRDVLREDPVSLPRLLGILLQQDAPVIRLLGWPGSGRRRLFAALARGLGPEAAFLAGDGGDVAPSVRQLDGQLQAARSAGARWFFCAQGLQGAGLVAALGDAPLLPDERVVISAETAGWPVALAAPAVATLTWQELLLTPSELETLVGRIAGEQEDPACVDSRQSALAALHTWSEGWLAPCEAALRCSNWRFQAQSSATQEPSTVVWSTAPGLVDFLRFRVLDRLTASDRHHLTSISLAIADGCTLESELRSRLAIADVDWNHLLHQTGWIVRGEGGTVRVPGPLAEALVDEARRAPGAKRQARVAARTRKPATPQLLPVPAKPSGFRLRLLGTVELARIDDRHEPSPRAWPFRRVIEILALLATSPDFRCRRERLLEAVWPGREAEMGERSLHPTVSHLRRLLGEPKRQPGGAARSDAGRKTVVYRQGVYSLESAESWLVDVVDFLQLTAELTDSQEDDPTSLADLQSACALYRGPFMEGFQKPWILETRRALAARYCRAQQAIGRRCEQLGWLQDAEDAFRRLLQEDPVHEPVHLAIMRLYARRGRPDLVRRQYERLCQIMLAELQMRPMDSTAREYQRLIGWSR